MAHLTVALLPFVTGIFHMSVNNRLDGLVVDPRIPEAAGGTVDPMMMTSSFSTKQKPGAFRHDSF